MEQRLIRLLKNPITNDDDMKEFVMLSSRVDLDNTQPPALLLAARHQDVNVINVLLYNGANVNIQNNRGLTALIVSASLGKYRLVDLLLNNGADPNLQDVDGLTPLMYTLINDIEVGTVMYERYMNCIDILLSTRYTNVDLRDNQGMTALMYASEKGNIEAVNLLLYNRANPFIRNDNGHTAYDLCTNSDVKKLIRNYEEQINVEHQILLMSMKDRQKSITPSIAKNISSFLFKSKRRKTKSKVRRHK